MPDWGDYGDTGYGETDWGEPDISWGEPEIDWGGYEGAEGGGTQPTPTPTPAPPSTPGEPGPFGGYDTFRDWYEHHIYETLTTEEEPSEVQTAINEYILDALSQEPDPEAEALKQEWIAFSRTQLQNIQDAKELGELTGDLSPEEIGKLDTLEANAIKQLTTQVNKQLEERMGTEIASLVSRGVLQGAIGSETMAKLGESALEVIERGTTSIGSTRISQELGMMDKNKRYQLELQRLVQTGMITKAQAGTMMAGGALGFAQGAEQFKLGTGLQAGQWATGLEQQWDIAQLGPASGIYGSQANAALQQAIAGQQSSASSNAAMWAALGTGVGWSLGGPAGGAVGGYFGSQFG